METVWEDSAESELTEEMGSQQKGTVAEMQLQQDSQSYSGRAKVECDGGRWKVFLGGAQECSFKKNYYWHRCFFSQWWDCFVSEEEGQREQLNTCWLQNVHFLIKHLRNKQGALKSCAVGWSYKTIDSRSELYVFWSISCHISLDLLVLGLCVMYDEAATTTPNFSLVSMKFTKL